MPGEKKDNVREVRVTVRISVPTVSMAGAVALEALIAEITEGLEGATYELGIGMPRPAVSRP